AVKRVAADAEIAIGLARGQPRLALLQEFLHAPAMGYPHALGMAHRDRLVDGIADQPVQDRLQRLLDQAADRERGLDAAGIDVAVGLDRDLRALMLALQKIEPARALIAEIVGERGNRDLVRPGPPARPQLADHGRRSGAPEI